MRLYVNLVVPVSGQVGLLAALHALVALDRVYLRSHRNTPSLYSAGVRYLRDVETSSQRRPDAEMWVTIPDALAARGGDCKVLSAWRVAELLERGLDAAPVLSRKGHTWHVRVRMPDGSVEDPSARLGMRGGA